MKNLKYVIYSIRLCFIVAAIYLLMLGKLDRQVLLIGSLALTFIPELFTWLFKIKIPMVAQLMYALFLLCSQFLGSFLGAYTYFPWWDIMLHVVSGVFVGYAALILLLTVDKTALIFKHKRKVLIVVFILTAVMSSTVIWEMIEFTGDTVFGLNAQLGSLQDTMEDMIYGTLGGLAYILYIIKEMKSTKKTSIDRLLELNKKLIKG